MNAKLNLRAHTKPYHPHYMFPGFVELSINKIQSKQNQPYTKQHQTPSHTHTLIKTQHKMVESHSQTVLAQLFPATSPKKQHDRSQHHRQRHDVRQPVRAQIKTTKNQQQNDRAVVRPQLKQHGRQDVRARRQQGHQHHAALHQTARAIDRRGDRVREHRADQRSTIHQLTR